MVYREASWSRKGEWIYFSWDQGTGRDIWRVPRDGGSPARVTAGSGLAAAEGADGATLFYLGRRTTRVHEPAFSPDPADYVSWDYARGFADATLDG